MSASLFAENQLPLQSHHLKGEELCIDLFAGGGGVSEGLKQWLGRDPDVAINHDEKAIAMHKANHPGTKHYNENIWQVNPLDVLKEFNNRPIGLLWASPDCKHFSRAKGGTPLSRNIRALAWTAITWAKLGKPRIIMIENVPEFTSFGPVCVNTNKAIKDKAGTEFKKWLNELKKAGYEYEWKILRCSDFGAPTIRRRFFLVARCDGEPIEWPEISHGAEGTGLTPYRTSGQCIDWTLPGRTIFREKPLADKTMARIAKGIERFIVKSPKPFIIKVNHSQSEFRGQSIDEPIQTITQKNGYALVEPQFEKISHQSKPGTLQAAFITKFNTGATGSSLHEPLHTIVAGSYQKRPGGSAPIGLVTSNIIKYRSTNIGHDLNEPLHTISAGGNHFGEVRSFCANNNGLVKMDYALKQKIKQVDDYLHHYGYEASKKKFSFRRYKKRNRNPSRFSYDGQTYCIVDIHLRMLEPHELFTAQGFPPHYIIKPKHNGRWFTKSDQVNKCGNSVPPVMAYKLAKANYVPRTIH